MFQERDYEILKFLAFFGKSYVETLHKTFFYKKHLQACKNRLSVLKNKYKVLRYKKTGLLKPSNYIVLTDFGKEICVDKDFFLKKSTFFSLSSVSHNMLEQETYFWFSKIRKIEIASVFNESKKFSHIPDFFYYTSKGNLVFIECELTKKSKSRYLDIFSKITKDEVSTILYITRSKEDCFRFAKIMPYSEKVRFCDIDTLRDFILLEKKIKSFSINEILEKRNIDGNNGNF